MNTKALVWFEAKAGRSIGQVERLGGNELSSLSGNFYNSMVVIDIPSNLQDKELHLLKATLTPDLWVRDGYPSEADQPTFSTTTWIQDGEVDTTTQPTFASDVWFKAGQPIELTDPQDASYSFYPAGSYDFVNWTQKEPGQVDDRYSFEAEHFVIEEKAAQDYSKPERISQAYEAMNTYVLSEMSKVFGTTSTESATAYEATWRLMIASPSLFVSAGLTARFGSAGLNIGDALDTDQKVQDYANAKIAEVEAYAVNRMQRIEQFRSEKAAIEAE